jgi:hypothetical protein
MATFTFQNGDGPYPLFPPTITPTSFELRHRRTTLVSDARSMKRQSRSEGTFRFPPLPTADYADMIAFFRQLDGRSTTFALRIPSLRSDNASDSTLRIGEYYNRASTTLANQLVQYVGLSGAAVVCDPPARDSGTVALRTHAEQLPTLRCSLATDAPTVEYSDDGFVRVSLDVIERW